MATKKLQMLGYKIVPPEHVGKSAYEIAVDKGFEGTEEEWLESLKADGAPAGFGLGEFAATGITDCNELTKNGWYSTTADALHRPVWVDDDIGECVIFVISNGTLIQQIGLNGIYLEGSIPLTRAYTGSDWTEWTEIVVGDNIYGWLNEYATTNYVDDEISWLWGLVDDHGNNTENPHQVNADQVGAAPAGYGLGDTSSPVSDWATSSQSGNGYIRSNVNSPDGAWWYGLNIKYDQGIAAQLAFKRVFNNEPPVVAIRHRPNYGESLPWGEWEYANPPMLEGVEYRTTERFNGKPVYTKLIATGDLRISSSSNQLSTDALVSNESVDIIDVKAVLNRDGNSSGYFPLPYIYNGTICAYVYAGYVTQDGKTIIPIVTTKDITTVLNDDEDHTYAAYLTVKYTKNTEAAAATTEV